jgi:ubiquinone/menaquinone biosynthesis C-methylase UbiE
LPPDDPARIAEYYDSLSNSYDQLYGEEQSKKHQKVLTLVGGKTFDLLIDVGCGTGTMLRQIAGHSTRAVGTDISLGMLKNATRNATIGNIDFVRADCSTLPFRSAVSDCVLSISVMKTDHAQTQLSELWRIAMPGGTLMLTAFHFDRGTTSLPRPFGTSTHLKVPLSARESLYLITLPRAGVDQARFPEMIPCRFL